MGRQAVLKKERGSGGSAGGEVARLLPVDQDRGLRAGSARAATTN